jgi:hypothetical protein
MPIKVFDLPGYTPNLFEYEPLNIFRLINTILSEKLENDCNNPIFHADVRGSPLASGNDTCLNEAGTCDKSWKR